MSVPLRLFLVRHGATLANHEGRFLGRLDLSLSEQSQSQAQSPAAKLKSESIVYIVSSPLQRAYQIASMIAEFYHLSIALDERLLNLILAHGIV